MSYFRSTFLLAECPMALNGNIVKYYIKFEGITT